MKTFRVYFRDGNQKLFEATDMMHLMIYLVQFRHFDEKSFVMIEEVE